MKIDTSIKKRIFREIDWYSNCDDKTKLSKLKSEIEHIINMNEDTHKFNMFKRSCISFICGVAVMTVIFCITVYWR